MASPYLQRHRRTLSQAQGDRERRRRAYSARVDGADAVLDVKEDNFSVPTSEIEHQN